MHCMRLKLGRQRSEIGGCDATYASKKVSQSYSSAINENERRPTTLTKEKQKEKGPTLQVI